MLRKIWNRIFFWVTYPFVVTAFLLRERKRKRRIIPTVWLSSGELIHRDLEMYEPAVGDHFFTTDNLNDLTAARDNLKAEIATNSRVNFGIFVFLLAQFMSIRMDVTVLGVSIEKAPGVTEALLVVLTLSTLFSALRHRSLYVLESTMKSIIERLFAPEVRSLYLTRYFPQEQFGSYYPSSLPRLSQHKAISRLQVHSAMYFLLFVIAPVILTYYFINMIILWQLWAAPQFEIWSKLLFVYLASIWVFSTTYFITFRVRMPYHDYSINDYLDLTDQLNPEKKAERLSKIYGESSRDRLDLEQRGYLRTLQKQ